MVVQLPAGFTALPERARRVTHHTPEPFLTRGIPELQAHLDTFDDEFLGQETCADRGWDGGRAELARGVPVYDGGFAHAWSRGEEFNKGRQVSRL